MKVGNSEHRQVRVNKLLEQRQYLGPPQTAEEGKLRRIQELLDHGSLAPPKLPLSHSSQAQSATAPGIHLGRPTGASHHQHGQPDAAQTGGHNQSPQFTSQQYRQGNHGISHFGGLHHHPGHPGPSQS